jgi:hypothetical protein
MKGFCELIVREWLIRGHPFRERFGQVTLDTDGYTAQEVCLYLLVNKYLLNVTFYSHQFFFSFSIVFIN